MFDLGDVDAMIRLSSIVQSVAVGSARDEEIHSRIFRKYVRLEDIDAARSLMQRSWEVLQGLRDDRPAREFNRYFEAFEECATSCLSFFQDWGRLRPVRVARVDIPAYLIDSKRSLEVIDSLPDEDEPFWQVRGRQWYPNTNEKPVRGYNLFLFLRATRGSQLSFLAREPVTTTRAEWLKPHVGLLAQHLSDAEQDISTGSKTWNR